MIMALPNGLTAQIDFDFHGEETVVRARFTCEGKAPRSYVLRGDSDPEIRYLIVLYFYDERINVTGKAPHAIELNEYIEIYEALFGTKCVYTDKHKSLDHIRSAELPSKLLKQYGLKLAKGGLCEFTSGNPDPAARNRFRAEICTRFNTEISAGKQNHALIKRYVSLRKYLSQSPAAYIGLSELLPLEIDINGELFTLYDDIQTVPWLRLIEKYGRIAVRGSVGSGKSVLLKAIAINPDVTAAYKVTHMRLIDKEHLFSRGEMDKICRFPGVKHLYLLDGFNEIPRDGLTVNGILSDIGELSAQPNVRVIVSATGANEAWTGFAQAKLLSVLPCKTRGLTDKNILETPLNCMAYLSIPEAQRRGLNSEYSLIEYSLGLRSHAAVRRARAGEEALIRVAYGFLMPALADMLCKNDRLSFTDDEKNELFNELKPEGSEYNTMLKSCFAEAYMDLPSISEWTNEQLENAFRRLVENGEIVAERKKYMFAHQRLRDCCAVKFELDKLKVIISNASDKNIRPEFNLGSSAYDLMRDALGIDRITRVPKTDFIEKEIYGRIEKIEDGEQLTPQIIKLAYSAAQIFEYLLARIDYQYDIEVRLNNALNRLTDWICEYTDETRRILNLLNDKSLDAMLAFVLCKQAEIYGNWRGVRSDVEERIAKCRRLTETGLKLFGGDPRLNHCKTKALLFLAERRYSAGDANAAKEYVSEALDLLKQCMGSGSFLSANLLAFMKRSPAPFVTSLVPNIINYAESFAINVLTATDPRLTGIKSSYARNEAVEALLTGEVKIKAFAGLRIFADTIKDMGGAQKLIARGLGAMPGKKELKLAKALLSSKGGTIGDNRTHTAFFEFMLDLLMRDEPLGREALEEMRKTHALALKQAAEADKLSRAESLLSLLALYRDMGDDIDYSKAFSEELCRLISELNSFLDKPNDMSLTDMDHPYYILRRLRIYYKILVGSTNDERLLNQTLLCEESLKRFELKYPAVISQGLSVLNSVPR